jgi:cystathionine beta-lyase/cystathionine gamma-synthase
MHHEGHGIETKLIHAGSPRPRHAGAVVTPIFQSSTYEYAGERDYHDVRYIRLNTNPNQVALNRKIAELEGSEDAIVACSGMAAISAALLTVLSSGDHVLAQKCLYGGTHGLLTKDLPRFGITHTFVDANDPTTWSRAMKPNTKAFYVETLANPLLEIPDIRNVVEFARANKLVRLIDNTFASPINFRPVEHGFDVTLESCTKYLNGHDDLVAGVAVGKKETVRAIKHRLDHLGGSLDPHACFLLERGLKTLAVRMRFQAESAAMVAAFLDGHAAVKRVLYPGLKSHPQHGRAAELLGGFGGILSFELKGGVEAADRFLKKVTIPAVAVSIGGVESLIIRPAAAVHPNLSAAERAASGIPDGLIRFSIGLESADDLIADLEQALSA